MSQLVKQFRAAKRAATPLIAIHTPDPADTVRSIVASFNGANGNGSAPPVFEWDIVRGLSAVNKTAEETGMASDSLIPPVDMLMYCHQLPENAVVFIHNAHRFINEQGVSQAIWNLRDSYKRNARNLVLLSPTLDLPIELRQDVMLLDEPLPTNDQLKEIVLDIFKSASLPDPDEAHMTKAVDALSGLAAFPAGQESAMCITPKGLNLGQLWERKRKVIEQQKGLSVWRGHESFASIGGYANLKQFLKAVIGGRRPLRGVLFLDEIEKSIGGAGHDSSGVSQDALGQLLAWMNDTEARGLLLVGPPGTSKSLFAKATGNEAGVPTIAFDLGGMKGSLVGESEAAMRTALKVCDAVTQKQALVIGTCNSINALPPELRRRFTMGVFFTDLPNSQEREAIWDLYLAKYSIEKQKRPNDEGWTGAEIKTAAQLCWDLGISLMEAKDYIVPVAKSAAEQIEALRNNAHGRYISASYTGMYDKDAGKKALPNRKLEVI